SRYRRVDRLATVVAWTRCRFHKWRSRLLPLFGLPFRHVEHSRPWAVQRLKLAAEVSLQMCVVALRTQSIRTPAALSTPRTVPPRVFPTEDARHRHWNGSMHPLRPEHVSARACRLQTTEDLSSWKLFRGRSGVSRFRFEGSRRCWNALRKVAS